MRLAGQTVTHLQTNWDLAEPLRSYACIILVD